MASRGDINSDSVQPELSKRWLQVSIEETLEKAGSYTKLKSKDFHDTGIYPVVDQGDKFISGYIENEDLLYKGELPVIIFGDHTRNIKYVDFSFAAGADGTKILKPNKLLDPKFYYYYFQSLNIPDLGYSRHFAILKQIKFPLPLLAEQQRIVTKLDLFFTQLDIIKNSLKRIPELLKIFRQQVLTQAVTGKLTEEWRKGKDLNSMELEIDINIRSYHLPLPKKWRVYAFSDVADIKSNLVNPDDFLDLPLIAPDNIEALTGKLLSKPLTSEIRPISGKHFYTKGCIIYSKIRPYLSKVIIADFDGLCSADMYPVVPKFNVKYLYYYMLSEIFLSYANTAGERSVLPKINQKGLNIIPVPFPPLVEQQEIVRRVESLFAKADAIEEQYMALKDKIHKLPQAILHKAFKGELTEQLDSDGDTADLLKAIQKLKESVTKTKKPKPYATNEKLRMVAEPK